MNITAALSFITLYNQTHISPDTHSVFLKTDHAIEGRACGRESCFAIPEQYLTEVEQGVLLLQFAHFSPRFKVIDLYFRAKDRALEKQFRVLPAILTDELQYSLHVVQSSTDAYLLFPTYFPSDLMLVFDGYASKSIHRAGYQTPTEATFDDYLYVSGVTRDKSLTIMVESQPYRSFIFAMENQEQTFARAMLYSCLDSRCAYVYDKDVVADSRYESEILHFENDKWTVNTDDLMYGFYMLFQVDKGFNCYIVNAENAPVYHYAFDPTEVLVALGIVVVFGFCYWMYQRIARRTREAQTQ